MNIEKTIATELEVNELQIIAAIKLLDEGSTVPFIARYRKEATGGLSDTQLRNLEQRLYYLRELEERRATILNSINEQGKLTDELKAAILDADNKALLEDLYLPYKPKRRTKAQIAREAGLEPLALELLNNHDHVPDSLAENYLDAEKNINTIAEALDGARQILMEHFSENAALLTDLREYLWLQGVISSVVVADKQQEAAKFSDYFAYQEPIHKVPSHRALALLRGQREGFLNVNLTLKEGDTTPWQKIAAAFAFNMQNKPADQWLSDTIDQTWKIKIYLKLELDCFAKLREAAEQEAINVFADNLKQLLLAAPAGSRVTMGLDPGLRTGVKVVVVDGTGKLLQHGAIFPHAPRNDWDQSLGILTQLVKIHNVELISIGNGTASRETDKLASELIKLNPNANLTKIVVSEAGASVYSASELAANEFPDLDVSYRGAVSIARRLQDPLAELVKIDPKSIGVGQYQHDVNQIKLGRSLQAVMEDCVNAVGVDINTASAPLLASVSGLSESLANNIIEFRNQKGAFKNREQLKQIPRFGAKTFEQAAGFLRIVNGDNPLDTSAVHPEAYSVVEKILLQQKRSLKEIMGNQDVLQKLKAPDFTDEQFGLPTVIDILKELEKPGRDPRPAFTTATFKDGVEDIKDVKPDMILEGVVTNVANFGAFVDIGVHQDGLVHISALTDRFIKDPKEVVKVGDIVKVKVVDVDLARKRIALTMRLNQAREKMLIPEKVEKKPIKMPVNKTPNNSSLGDALKRAFEKG